MMKLEDHKKLFDKVFLILGQESIEDTLSILGDYLAFQYALNENKFECIHQYMDFLNETIVECYEHNKNQKTGLN